MRTHLRPFAVIGALAALAVGLGGCGGSEPTASSTDTPTATVEATTLAPETATDENAAADGATPTAAAEQRVPAAGTTGALTVTGTSVILGNPEAPELITIYQDMNCPHCAVLHGLMADDIAAWSQGDNVAVEVVVVDYLGPRTTHIYSTRAANVLALVSDVAPEAWAAVQDALLAMQPATTTETVTDEQLIAAAEAAGVTFDDEDRAAIAGIVYSGWIGGATQRAAQEGINSIPQVWIDGARVAGETHEQTAELVREAVAG